MLLEMKRMLFLASNLGSGGAERQMVTVACLLKDAGHEVEFLCYAKGDFYAHILAEKQIPVHWRVLPNYLKRIFAVRKFIRRRSYDAVISFLETPNFLNCFAAMGGKQWEVITGERSAREWNFLTKRGKIFCWFQRFSDKIVCNSENAKHLWLKHCPYYANKLITIYNGVNLLSPTTQYVPKRNGELHIVVAASFQYLKNPIGLIRALALLNDEDRKKIHVDWYGRKEIVKGDSHAYDESANLIEELELQDVIALHGDTMKIHDKMEEADIVALFSKYEGLPNAICEGMMLGKGIIMTKVSYYSVLVDDTNGFLCDDDTPVAIKDALCKAIILSEKELLLKGENSKRKAVQLFSLNRVQEQWKDVVLAEKANG